MILNLLLIWRLFVLDSGSAGSAFSDLDSRWLINLIEVIYWSELNNFITDLLR